MNNNPYWKTCQKASETTVITKIFAFFLEKMIRLFKMLCKNLLDYFEAMSFIDKMHFLGHLLLIEYGSSVAESPRLVQMWNI